MKTTIVVSPRERFSPLIPTLKSLFETIPDDVPVIVVEGQSPDKVRKELSQIQKTRRFEHVALPYLVTPNEARNIGARRSDTKFIAFCDNDIEYQHGWLEHLEKNAAEHSSDLVAPLIFIGPGTPPLIHHAGGELHYMQGKNGLMIKEIHRLMNRSLTDVKDHLIELAPLENEVAEFHCLLMRKSFYDRMGGLDERLITREQMDVALRAKALGAKVTFEKNSLVTYLAYMPFEKFDISYHLFRWSDELVLRSIAAFEQSWDVKLDANRIRYNWVRNHRRRAVSSMSRWLAGIFGPKLTGKLLTPIYEQKTKWFVTRLRPDVECLVPHKVAGPDFVLKLAEVAGKT